MNLSLAFLLGLLGSVHCAVMCGPLMLSLYPHQTHLFRTVLQICLYQIGRILVYTLLGFIVGGIGSSIAVFTNQETLSLAVGFILIFFTVLHFLGKRIKVLDRLQSRLIRPISKLMAKVYHLPGWALFAGILNGLIPCGMVYLAMASALNMGTAKSAGSFMLLFGIGTTPLMFIISISGFYLNRYINLNMSKLMPWLTLFLGVIFVLRASELGIPYLSPNHHLRHGTTVECR